jgi:outer membrane receptor protein involved in Fe transport
MQGLQNKVRHTKSLSLKVEDICRRLDVVLEEEKETFRFITELSETRFDDLLKEKVTRKLFGIKPEFSLDSNDLSTRTKNNLSRFYIDLNGEINQKGDNLWGLFSGVTKYTTHSYSKNDNTEVKMFGNVGQSNRVPTVIELGCADATVGCRLPTGLQADPYLKQVIARTLEFGTRWKLTNDSGYTASIYRSDNTNDILFTPTDQTGLGYFSNFSKTRRQGLDLSAYTRINQVDLRISYSYLQATYQAEGELFGGEREITIKRGARIAGLPEHTIKLNADWRVAPKWLVGGTVIATSNLVSQGNEDGQSEEGPANAKVDGYLLLNMHAKYSVTKGLDYFARLNNVFDRRYETYGLMSDSLFNSAGVASSTVGASRFVAPGAPRAILVGLHYRF